MRLAPGQAGAAGIALLRARAGARGSVVTSQADGARLISIHAPLAGTPLVLVSRITDLELVRRNSYLLAPYVVLGVCLLVLLALGMRFRLRSAP